MARGRTFITQANLRGCSAAILLASNSGPIPQSHAAALYVLDGPIRANYPNEIGPCKGLHTIGHGLLWAISSLSAEGQSVQLWVVYGMGNPWVINLYPYPYPPKPTPLTKGKGLLNPIPLPMGMGFDGYG